MTATQFLELFVSLAVQAGVVVLLVHWLCRLTDDERVQYRLWLACCSLLLALVAAGVLLPHLRLVHAASALDAPLQADLAVYETRLGSGLFVVWCTGALLAGAIPLLQSVRVRLFLRRCEPLDEHRRRDLLSAAEQGGLETVRVLTSPDLATPFCAQFHRPCIVLPAHLLKFEPAELRRILRHELEHLATGHPLHLFLQRVVETLFWFHPMVWWATQQFALCREFVCDSAAVSSRSDIVAYLKTLLRVIEGCAGRDPASPLAFGRGRSSVARRAERLVARAAAGSSGRDRRRPAGTLTAGLLMASLLVSCLWLPVDVFGSPRSRLSPWPAWSTGVLHGMGVRVRDYEVYHPGVRLHELRESESPQAGSRNFNGTQRSEGVTR